MCLDGYPTGAGGSILAEKDNGTMGLFDSPTHLLIILAVLVVLFGSAKLPKAAKSMGEAMRIFKKESAKLHDEDTSAPQQAPAWEPQQVASPQPQVTPPQPTAQEQMTNLMGNRVGKNDIAGNVCLSSRVLDPREKHRRVRSALGTGD